MNRIESHFSKTVSDYDTVADKVVFKNDELHHELVNCLDFKNRRGIRVLDLGCGTGHGIELVAGKFPNFSWIAGFDFSPLMIKKAKLNLADISERVSLYEQDFRDYTASAPLDQFDAVISAIAIHNISDSEKKTLFGKIYSSLGIGGIFANADFYKHENLEYDEKLRGLYRKFLVKNLSGKELDAWLEHAFEDDKPMPILEQKKILKEIGFRDFQLHWIFNNEAVYSARK